jgi:hypothetical protein
VPLLGEPPPTFPLDEAHMAWHAGRLLFPLVPPYWHLDSVMLGCNSLLGLQDTPVRCMHWELSHHVVRKPRSYKDAVHGCPANSPAHQPPAT